MFPSFPWSSVRPFNNQYRCFSVSMFPGKERAHIEKGGKIIMPPSALDQLSQLNVPYPMLFKVTNKNTDRVTHCGVLEFVAEEGKVYMPYWMMQNLLLQEGDLVRLETADLPKATFSKFQPLALTFLEITNPKAVLENSLRNYACLTTGDVIAIHYNESVFEISVLETKPGAAVSIIECDMNVDFAPPLGYTEDLKKKNERQRARTPSPMRRSRLPAPVLVPEKEIAGDGQSKEAPFTGHGQRLDGKSSPGPIAGKKGARAPSAAPAKPAEQVKAPQPVEATHNAVVHMDDIIAGRAGIPDYDFKIGSLTFMPGVKIVFNQGDGTQPKDGKDGGGSGGNYSAFSGAGHKLK